MFAYIGSDEALLSFLVIPGFIDFLFCCWVGSCASNKGRSFWAGFFLSVFFTPIIGGIAVGLMSNARQGAAVRPDSIDSIENTRVCPFCAERIKAQATVCRFCGRDLPPLPVEALDPIEDVLPEPELANAFDRATQNSRTMDRVAIGLAVGVVLFGGITWAVRSRQSTWTASPSTESTLGPTPTATATPRPILYLDGFMGRYPSDARQAMGKSKEGEQATRQTFHPTGLGRVTVRYYQDRAVECTATLLKATDTPEEALHTVGIYGDAYIAPRENTTSYEVDGGRYNRVSVHRRGDGKYDTVNAELRSDWNGF